MNFLPLPDQKRESRQRLALRASSDTHNCFLTFCFFKCCFLLFSSGIIFWCFLAEGVVGMEGNESPRKVGVQIAVGNEDDDDDPVTPESNVVKAKLEAHNIKQMGALLKVGK
jgi:hypothetical protein